MKQFIKKTGLALLLASITTVSAWADDVEIYFNTSSVTDAGDPLVMFSIDWRPSLTAQMCNFAVDVSECGWDADINAAFSADDLADTNIQFFELLRAALRVVLDEVDGVKVGLMLNHAHVNGCEGNDSSNSACSNGGYIAMGFQSVDGVASTTGGDDVLLAKLAAIPLPQGNLSHKYQGAELYFEFFRYLTGQGIYNGHVGYVDYDDGCDKDNLDDNTDPSPSCTEAEDDDYPDISWDATHDPSNPNTAPYSVENATHDTYISPFTDAGTECSGVYAINLMFGVSQQENDSDDAIDETKANGGMDQLGISNSTPFLDTIDWMYADIGGNRDLADGTYGSAPDRTGDQNVTSYFLYNGNVANTMNAYASAGGTTEAIEVSDDPSAMVDTLINIFESIKRQNSTFEAPAVTVNSYSSLTHRDELYYALFSPEETGDWPGNLKKYKLIEVPIDEDGDGITDYFNTTVGDQNEIPAVAEQSELFLPTACSYWTDCTTVDRSEPADGEADPDGDQIDWGGAAEELTNSRNILTDVAGSMVEVHEDTSAITAYMLGVTSATIATDMDGDSDYDNDDIVAQRQRLLRLARGVDPDTPTTALQTLGDPIHSRPSVIEYDAKLTEIAACEADPDCEEVRPDLAIAMATNEGYFHLFNEDTGAEYFAYIPEDLLPLVGKINGPIAEATIAEGGTAEGPNRFNTYGLDASPVIWSYDFDENAIIDHANDHVWAFLAQRRGGRNLYALDITNRNAPTLKWKIEGGAGDFVLLGQTWSEPAKAVIMISGEPTPVLIFGGGYDDGQDDAYSQSDTVGRAIYVVNADTGALIWTISAGSADLNIPEMDSSIPAKVRLLDIDNDYIVDRLYAVDIVGRIFRVDFDTTTDEANTAIYGGGMIASLYEPLTGTCTETAPTTVDGVLVAQSCHRRFYNAPDIALMVGYPLSPYIQIAVGSGYRAFPVTVTGIQNRFYVTYDSNVVGQLPTDHYGTTGTYVNDQGITVDKEYHWTEADNYTDVTTIPDTSATLGDATTTATAALTAIDNHGWFFDMDSTKNEHVLTESVTLQGYTFFSTYLRDPDAVDECSVDLGQGRLYIVNAFNGLPAAALAGDKAILAEADSVTSADRHMNLDRTGIAADPLVVFRENSEGKIDPTLIVGSDVLESELLEEDSYSKTWWIDVD